MQRTNIALFLTAVGLIGIAPLLLGAVYVARRRIERNPENERTSRSLVVIVAAITGALIVVGGIVAWTFSRPGPPPSSMQGMGGVEGTGVEGATIPMELAGQPLTAYLEGPDAIAAVGQLHGSAIPVTDAQVATYGNGLATIWRSGAPDAATAAEQVASMRDRIAGGGSPFATPRPVRRHPDVYATSGMGQRHFFFSSGASVWWVTVVPGIARQALLEILGAAA